MTTIILSTTHGHDQGNTGDIVLTPFQLFGVLSDRPFPGATDLRMSSGACCFTVDSVAVVFTHNLWVVFGEVIRHELPAPLKITAEHVHAEIARVLALSDGVGHRNVEAQLAQFTAERDAALAVAADLERQLNALKREHHNSAVRNGEKIQDLKRQIRDLENEHCGAGARMATMETPCRL